MLPPTIPLYFTDAYQAVFSARVLSCTKDVEKPLYHVVLDKTCFFPEQGGQTADTGTLGGNVRVLDAHISRGVIDHLTDGPLAPGCVTEGRIDFARRFSHMQQHTGEHIFSGLVYALFGFHNVGFHLSDHTVTMDYDGYLPQEQVRALEDQANLVIWRNLPVLVSFPDGEELKGLFYRSKKEVEGPLRLVTIPGVDVCACCAPHVRRTGEIGFLRVMSAMRYKGGSRLSILCGGRALSAARQERETLTELSRLLSCTAEEAASQVKRLSEKEKQLSLRLAQVQAAQLTERAERVPDERSTVILEADDVPEKAVSEAVNVLAEGRQGVCGVLFGPADDRKLMLVSRHIPLKHLAQALREETGFRGGGDDGCVRGKTSLSAAVLEEWLSLRYGNEGKRQGGSEE